MPSIIEVDHIEGNNYVVHAYEIIQDDEKTWHTATAGWYYLHNMQFTYKDKYIKR